MKMAMRVAGRCCVKMPRFVEMLVGMGAVNLRKTGVGVVSAPLGREAGLG